MDIKYGINMNDPIIIYNNYMVYQIEDNQGNKLNLYMFVGMKLKDMFFIEIGKDGEEVKNNEVFMKIVDKRIEMKR